MSLDLELKDVARQAVEQHLRSPECMTVISDAVRKTVDAAIKETLASYSDFGKQVKEAVSQSLRIYGPVDLPTYNDMLLKIIAAQVEAATKDSIEQQVAERVKFLLEPIPAEIKLSELVEQYRAFLKDQRDSGCPCDSSQEFFFDVSELKHGMFIDVSLSKSKPERYSPPDIRFGLSRSDDHPRDANSPFVGRIYTLSVSGAANVEKQMFTGPFYAFERTLFQLQAAKTAVIVDVDASDVDTSYGDYDD